jgi:hypothetical protein
VLHQSDGWSAPVRSVDRAGQAGGYSSRTTSVPESLSDFSRPYNKTTPKTQPARKENPTQNLTKQLQKDKELTSSTKTQRHTSQAVHPRQFPQETCTVRPVKSTGQTDVVWAARDEQHPRSTPPKPNFDLPNHSTDLNKTLGIIGTPHEESIAMILSTKTCQMKRNQRNPSKNSSNPRKPKTPKSSPLTHGLGRGITGQRTTKGSHKFSRSNPQEQGPKNTPGKTPREGSENHHQEQPGTTQQSLEEPCRIIYTYQEVHTRSSLLPNHPTISQNLTMNLSS